LGIIAWLVVFGAAVSLWINGRLTEAPSFIEWLLLLLLGTQSFGMLVARTALNYHFSKDRTVALTDVAKQ
jgi:hypothetical protein